MSFHKSHPWLRTLPFILVSCFYSSCSKDAINTKSPSKLTTVIDRGNILDLAVNGDEVYFLNSNKEIGIYNRNDSTFRFYNEFNSDLRSFVGIDKLKNGRIIVGEGTHGLSYFDKNERKTFREYPTLKGFDLSGNYCTITSSTFEIENTDQTRLNMFSTFFSGGISKLTCLAAFRDTLWVGTLGYGLFHVDIKRRVAKQFSPAKVGHHRVKTVRFDQNNNLYVLTETGLAVRREGVWSQYTNPGVKNNSLSLVDDVVYIATNLGVYILKDDVIQPVIEINTQLSYPVVNVVEVDQEGMVWIGTGIGLYTYESP